MKNMGASRAGRGLETMNILKLNVQTNTHFVPKFKPSSLHIADVPDDIRREGPKRAFALMKQCVGDDSSFTATKRSRSPSHSLGWAEYDADILDNMKRTKRFAVDLSMASDLASRMSMQGLSPCKSVTRPANSDQMCISSPERSPAQTPKPRGVEGLGLAVGLAATPGWSTPVNPLTTSGGLKASTNRSVKHPDAPHSTLTSPSDAFLEGVDLRKVTLRRLALARATPNPKEEKNMIEQAIFMLPSPAVSYRRSKLAQRIGTVSPSAAALRSVRESQLPRVTSGHNDANN